MRNSRSSILPLFNALNMLVLNTANADVTMSTNFITFTSSFWYFLVSTVAMPLTLTPVRETASRGILTLTRTPVHILNVATLSIPVATLRLLEQVFSHVSQSNIVLYFSYFFLYLSSSFNNLAASLEPRLGGRIVGPREPKAQLGELVIHYSSSSF